MNRLQKTLIAKPEGLLTIYFTAGHPSLNDTAEIIKLLDKHGADIIEIGMPFSDPLADGETIQKSSLQALSNGMNLERLFEQLKEIRQHTQIPILLMGYLNPVMRFGMDRFVEKCVSCGLDGTIIPDLPLHEYEKNYKSLFDANNLCNVLLITPETPENRIRKIDDASTGFIYMVSSASTTGAKSTIATDQESYFDRINGMNLKTPRQIGFGISNNETFSKACKYASGAIIGSAFIKALNAEGELEAKIEEFIKMIRG